MNSLHFNSIVYYRVPESLPVFSLTQKYLFVLIDLWNLHRIKTHLPEEIKLQRF